MPLPVSTLHACEGGRLGNEVSEYTQKCQSTPLTPVVLNVLQVKPVAVAFPLLLSLAYGFQSSQAYKNYTW